MIPEPDPESEAEADTEAGTEADTEAEVRAVFARAAHDITPGPVPLAAVRREGRARRRRRTVALTVLSVAGIATVTAAAVSLAPSPGPSPLPVPPPTRASVAAPPSLSPSPSAARPPLTTPPRVVSPGEKVNADGGWKLWLTEQGKFWSGPDGYENFRSVVDGNVAVSEPGVSHQSEGDAKGAFRSGLYYGTRTVGRVEVADVDGKKAVAALLELPGAPGWGVWYVRTGPMNGDPGVTLYDRTGKALAELPAMPRTP
ncbi:hypothetical protein [Streptomyces vilmorinianum]|uniref:hypothetical protein n=1 Tax=Streptomyces vilmorinianum TaxID=3051092 RepID=UPI0010FBA3CE|nr:hypothetical protein [Streptomyces vilmorinianum]